MQWRLDTSFTSSFLQFYFSTASKKFECEGGNIFFFSPFFLLHQRLELTHSCALHHVPNQLSNNQGWGMSFSDVYSLE